ncbi:unnamed protein product [Lepeophtheirus salmonis]|uniref:(salmon louse) hypothetical protein n=1 Tax=Lepeophtheirus salmonis TaxID=72036 RepID=A0A7R8CL95_LEPSM|nr:unnamed protein product [Lepeophtheirus salmonis]CAF2853559.1 unnamed protein product [Lepeophtheirus salmonis]
MSSLGASSFSSARLPGSFSSSSISEARDGLVASHSGETHSHEASIPAASFSSLVYQKPLSYGEETEFLPDLTPLILGILVITGLSLLFPTFISVSTSRRKRDLPEGM